MDIIHHVNGFTLSRAVNASLADRLAVMPAVVVTGARQTGKSTLVESFEKRKLFSLDDFNVRDAARRDPDILVGGSMAVTIDEIQREPDLLLAVKRAIDVDRQPGRFLLTGSANLLLMNKVSESLAGRASYLTLWPMTRREQMGFGQCGIWEELLSARDEDWHSIVNDSPAEKEDWRDLARRGGFPTPALHLNSSEERAIWFDGYVRTYLERDLQALAAIEALPDFRRLMRAASHRLGGLVNQTDLGRDVAMAQTTVHRYLNLLETSYMLVRLPAYSVNRTKRLVKAPKLYWTDTGIALHIAESSEPSGEHLENLVLNDLLVWRDSRMDRSELFYWRTQTGEEVDLVIESGGRLLPVEVKSKDRPRISDAKHLRTFRKEYADRSRFGLLIHTGDAVEWLAPDVLAVPWWKIL